MEIDLGYNPCPKCGYEKIDYGKGTGSNKYMYYARCKSCGYERWIQVHEDTYHHSRLADIITITRDAWNDKRWEDDR